MIPWYKTSLQSATCALVTALLLSGCGAYMKRRKTEVPPPNPQVFDKDFFRKVVDGPNGTKIKVPKTFACGWAVENSAGMDRADADTLYNQADHCNIEFDLDTGCEKILGKMVMPSKIGKPEEWPTVVAIPIKRHFFIEHPKAGNGKARKSKIEYVERGTCHERTHMELDIAGIEIKGWSFGMFYGRNEVDGVFDIEQDAKGGFLAFSTRVSHSARWYDGQLQASYRFNFLEFTHDPTFVKTPFPEENSKHLNVLNILGEKVPGALRPILYAAHWDTRTTTPICLNGFPEEYVQIGHDTVAIFNDEFEKIGHGRPFTAKECNKKHTFDLREATINWIADVELGDSSNAPLGLAMNVADVRNGKVLWGGVNIWGAQLEGIVNHYAASPRAALSAVGGAAIDFASVQLGLIKPFSAANFRMRTVPEKIRNVPSEADAYQGLLTSLHDRAVAAGKLLWELDADAGAPGVIAASTSPGSAARLASVASRQDEVGVQVDSWNDAKVALGRHTEASFVSKDLAVDLTRIPVDSVRSHLKSKINSIEDLVKDPRAMQEAARGYVDAATKVRSTWTERAEAQAQVPPADAMQDLLGFPRLGQSQSVLPAVVQRIKPDLGEKWSGMSTGDQKQALREAYVQLYGRSGSVQDMDVRVADVGPALAVAMTSADGRSRHDMLRSYLKKVVVHEFGHFVGLGHQHKENILPKRGSVPHKHYNELAAAARDGFKNYSSIMGYQSGEVAVSRAYEEVGLGPHDNLVLRYLYNREYPVVGVDLGDEEDFTFVKLEADGRIRESLTRDGRRYRVAFFPQCNDWTAMLGYDPFCNRWDRGYSAETLVKSYFGEYNATLSGQLVAFSDSLQGGAYHSQRSRLWSRSLETFSRVRMFYDYMRQEYGPEIAAALGTKSGNRIDRHLNFSEACANEEVARRNGLHQLFYAPTARSAEIRDLCLAVRAALSEWTSLVSLTGPDFSKLSYGNRYLMASVHGGEASSTWDYAFGTWREMSQIPIKISSLLSAATTTPFISFGGWLFPVPRYERNDGNFLMNTLYPKEMAQLVAKTVDNNLTFAGTSTEEKTFIGRSALSLGYFLMSSYFTNDALTAPEVFFSNIREQTDFQYSIVFVTVTADVENEKAKSFAGEIHSMWQRGSENLQSLYMYKDNRMVALPPARSLLHPLSTVRWFTQKVGYYFALKMDYADDIFDKLRANSVREILEAKYRRAIAACIDGSAKNGIRHYFGDEQLFKGFDFKQLHKHKTARIEFAESVQSTYDDYYDGKHFETPPDRSACDEAFRGQSLVVMTASALQGYRGFLNDFIEHGDE